MDLVTVGWEQLSASVQEAFGWAVAVELLEEESASQSFEAPLESFATRNPYRVGSRGLVLGMALADGDGEVEALLRFWNVSRDSLAAALQGVRPDVRIDPEPSAPASLADLPALTSNGEAVLRAATELWSETDPSGPLETRHLFGGILRNQDSRAYQALAQVSEGNSVDIGEIGDFYVKFLQSTPRTSFGDFLAARYPAADPPEGDRVEWITDSAARDDLLKRQALADVLATRLRRIKREAPSESFLIHVDGPWGSGKSTLLKFLAKELEDPAPSERPWLVVRYDAWRQTRVGPPWWTLLIRLREALRAKLPGRHRGVLLRVTEARHRIRTAGLLYLFVVAAAVVLFVVIGPGGVTAYITAISALIGGALAVGRFFLWDSAQGARVYENLQTNPMESLTDHFAWLITRSPYPVVFLIDELDRCSAEQVVDLLDSIQTIVRDAPRRQRKRNKNNEWTAPYFVIAADGAWIRRSYELAHEKMSEAVAEPGRPLGYLFLAKIFQLTVKMPVLTPELQSAYLHALLVGEGPSEEQREGTEQAQADVRKAIGEDQLLKAYGEAPEEVRPALAPLVVERLNDESVERQTEEHVLDKFGELLEPNPRAIKRVVIAYGIERSVRTLEGNLVSRDTLVLWTILNTRWPGLGEFLADHPEAVDNLRDGGDPPADVPPELVPLFKADAVSKVVKFPAGGPLNADLVAAAAGISHEQPRRPVRTA